MDRQGSLKESDKSLSTQFLEDIRQFFAALLLTAKNIALYPEGHSIGIQSIKQFHEKMEVFMARHGDIRIEFERDKVLCQGVEVQTGLSEEGSLPFTLFRDGVRWLEFTEGIRLEEIHNALSIIHKYSVLKEEPEGDIVTDFWEARFDHVQYKAADFFAKPTPDQLDNISRTPEENEDADSTASGSRKSAAEQPEMFDGPPLDPAAFALTPWEDTELQAMVYREETAEATAYLNMLLDSLLQYQEEKDFRLLLEVLWEECIASLNRHDFETSLIILEGLRKVTDCGQISTPWAGRLIEDFYKKISDPAYLKPLEEIWSNMTIQQLDTFRRIFPLLHPHAAETLTHLLLMQQPAESEKLVADILIHYVNKDANCLDSLIHNSSERIATKILSVLLGLEAKTSLKYLLQLARHSSISVRRMAIRAIAGNHGNQISAIFNFMDDPDASVRNMILKYMGQSRNETAEDLLLRYLQKTNFNDAESEQIIHYFRTLGKCGSSKSVPLLRKILLQRQWIAGLSKSADREGAALALIALNIPEAQKVIEEASRSLNPGLRKIVRDAQQEFIQEKGGGR